MCSRIPTVKKLCEHLLGFFHLTFRFSLRFRLAFPTGRAQVTFREKEDAGRHIIHSIAHPHNFLQVRLVKPLNARAPTVAGG